MQRLLLDTHALVWWLSDVSELAENTRGHIADPRNDVFVSATTGWEIAVKRAKGKITAPRNLAALVEERGFIHLPLTFHHAERAGDLPMHHRDPFDRLCDRPGAGRGAGPCHPGRPHSPLRSPHAGGLSTRSSAATSSDRQERGASSLGRCADSASLGPVHTISDRLPALRSMKRRSAHGTHASALRAHRPCVPWVSPRVRKSK